MYPCRFLGSLFAHCLDVKLGKLVSFGFPCCGIVIAGEYICKFHFNGVDGLNRVNGLNNLLIEEAGLLVFDAQLAIDGSKDSLYLSEGEHTS